jgi:hypothetical protein
MSDAVMSTPVTISHKDGTPLTPWEQAGMYDCGWSATRICKETGTSKPIVLKYFKVRLQKDDASKPAVLNCVKVRHPENENLPPRPEDLTRLTGEFAQQGRKRKTTVEEDDQVILFRVPLT